MLSDAFTWIVLHPFIAGAVLILCLIVLERLTRRKWPWRFKATVTYVCDGDSVWVKRTIGGHMKLRLLGMDAPETEQPYGPQATEALRKLILGKKIEGEAVTRDIYGRIVCRVVCDKRDMSLTMIRQGYAWPYYQYFYRLSPKERAAYKKAALLAKTEGRGLWQEKNPTAPWQWRKDHRTVFTRLMYWLRRFVRWILRR